MHVVDPSSGRGEDARPKAEPLTRCYLKEEGIKGGVRTTVVGGHILTRKFGPGFSGPGGRRG